MAASSPPLPPPGAAASTTLTGNLTASSLLSIPPPRPRLAAAHRRAVVAAAASPRPPPSPEGDDGDGQEVERAMGMDSGIPGTSGEFLRRVSSRAYGMRRHLMESLDSLAYDGNGSRTSTLLVVDHVPVALVPLGSQLGFGKLVV